MDLQKEKDKIISRINSIEDERVLWAIAKLMEIDTEASVELTRAQKKELDKRVETHNNKKSKSYSRTEARRKVQSER